MDWILLVFGLLAALAAVYWLSTRNPVLEQRRRLAVERAVAAEREVEAYQVLLETVDRRLRACSDVDPEAASLVDTIDQAFDQDGYIITHGTHPQEGSRTISVIPRDRRGRHS